MKSIKDHIRYWTGKLHLWLGLSSGLVVFIIAITGCLYAFQEEIQDLTQPYRFTPSEHKAMLLPSEMQKIAEQQLPGKHAHSVTYSGKGRSAAVIFYGKNPGYYYIIYLNPYSGQVLKVKDMDRDFFRFILAGHFYLWLPHEIGQLVTATATLLFILMISSGLFLWWPRNKNGVKQRFTIKPNVSWKRRNYDLHNVLGFYIFLLALILAMTGLVWGFKWFAGTVYYTASGGKKMVQYYEPLSDTTSQMIASSIPATDRLYRSMKSQYPSATSIEIHYPENIKTSIAVAINPDEGTYWKREYRYFDQYSLKETDVSHMWGKFSNANVADKLMRMNYDIHVGAILGLPGKFLAFCVSLVTASLPVTGFLIWKGRRKKQQKEKKIYVPENSYLS